MGRRLACIALGVFGSLALLGGGLMTMGTLSNTTQVIGNKTEYGPSMWRNAPAAKLFPKSLGTRPAGTQIPIADPKIANWRRVGISQHTGCTQALSKRAAAQAKARGCEAVLRATYVDPTGNVVATVAVVVLAKPGSDREDGLERYMDDEAPHAVRALPVRGTIAAGWSDERRVGSSSRSGWSDYLPYVIGATAGSVDGRMAGRLPGEWDSGNDTDRRPWEESAQVLAYELQLHMDDLLNEGVSS